MIKSYFKIALRNLANNKVYSLINILGLAMGITTCMLICLYVIDEASYDKQFADGERIFRVASEVKGEKWMAAAAPVAGGLKKDYPEVEQVTRLLRMPGVDKFLLNYEPNQKKFYETNGYYVDSTFFQLFNYNFKYGSKLTAFNQPNSIVISEEIASKLFGNTDPVDKVIKVTLPFGESSYTVKGVFDSQGGKSHIPAHMLLSMNNSDVGQWVKSQTSWANNSVFHTYVKLKKAADPESFESKLSDFFERNGIQEFKAAGYTKTLFLQPLQDIYLHSNFEFEIAPNGNVKYLYIFGSVAAFLLFIACINFMNLSTARSEKRAKEVGLRKTIGAVKSSLVGQFLGESILMSLLALVISFVLIQSLTPLFSQVTGKTLSLFDHPEIFSWLLALTLLTGLLSGLYPAFYLASFTPISVLKGRLKSSFSVVMIRKGLVVFQFSISMILILGALLIGRQMDYLSNRNLGFDKTQKLIFPLQSIEAGTNLKVLKNELANDPEVISSAKGSTYPGIENVQGMLFYGEGKASVENFEISTANIENDYLRTLGIQLLKGRGFSEEFKADSNAVVLNETALAKLGYTPDNAVGKNIYYDFQGKRIAMNIIGVVKDYHFEGLQKEIRPLALTISPFFSAANSYLIVNVKTREYSKLIGKIGQIWQKVNPNTPFQYSFLDQDFQKNYEKEERTSQLISYFAFIGIFIACLGLFGLATFTAEQRTKEIGIRKVLGASIFSITTLLSGDFLKLVFISILIASPLAWWAMDKWLNNFAFKTTISWQIFIIAGTMLIAMALITIGYQTVKAALRNPVRSIG
ncbi:ABC transporter permease [Dyadobacter sp. CY323]|uniref:ABC transporter permease n=1 Tax=Dyadobacter sp. CY323 TaxID=2907302 RepID=UPI001F3C1687|nr:ABC transporter permease [Dyadobacter sp. CY323]MCE6992425.1 ABC transporter permease [Dyadobacter sp. CY323]